MPSNYNKNQCSLKRVQNEDQNLVTKRPNSAFDFVEESLRDYHKPVRVNPAAIRTWGVVHIHPRQHQDPQFALANIDKLVLQRPLLDQGFTLRLQIYQLRSQRRVATFLQSLIEQISRDPEPEVVIHQLPKQVSTHVVPFKKTPLF